MTRRFSKRGGRSRSSRRGSRLPPRSSKRGGRSRSSRRPPLGVQGSLVPVPPSKLDRGGSFSSLFGSNSLQEQYMKSSSVGTIATWLQNLLQGVGNPSTGVYGPTLQGFNYEPPTSGMRGFERASGLGGSAEALAKQLGNRAMPSPLLWLLTPSLMNLFTEGSNPPRS